jgi:hypothetical protein
VLESAALKKQIRSVKHSKRFEEKLFLPIGDGLPFFFCRGAVKSVSDQGTEMIALNKKIATTKLSIVKRGNDTQAGARYDFRCPPNSS